MDHCELTAAAPCRLSSVGSPVVVVVSSCCPPTLPTTGNYPPCKQLLAAAEAGAGVIDPRVATPRATSPPYEQGLVPVAVDPGVEVVEMASYGDGERGQEGGLHAHNQQQEAAG
jgi:hypothetical protein